MGNESSELKHARAGAAEATEQHRSALGALFALKRRQREQEQQRQETFQQIHDAAKGQLGYKFPPKLNELSEEEQKARHLAAQEASIRARDEQQRQAAFRRQLGEAIAAERNKEQAALENLDVAGFEAAWSRRRALEAMADQFDRGQEKRNVPPVLGAGIEQVR